MSIKRLIAQIHLWLGLASGLVVFVLGITGAIYSFSDEIKDVVYKDRRFVNIAHHKEKLSLDSLLLIAQGSVGKDRRISRAELSQDPDRTYMFRAFKINPQGFAYPSYYEYYLKVYINPYTGKVVFKEDTRKEFFNVVLNLHMNLLLGDKIGHFIVKWSTVCFAGLLLSGLVLWWPKKWTYKQLKKRLSIKLNKKFKRTNYDLHNVLGFYSFLFLLVIALTGLAWSFNFTSSPKPTAFSDTTIIAKSPSNYILTQALIQAPKTAYFLYNFPSTKDGTVNVSAYQNHINFYDRTQYRFDQYSGKLLQSDRPIANRNLSAKLVTLNYDLHTGSVLGLFGKLFAFIMSLIAASLPITGLVIWLQKSK